MPHDHEAERELVQQTFSREWGNPAHAIRIQEFVPRFRVPGRRADGSSRSEHRVRHFFSSVVETLHILVMLAVGGCSTETLGVHRSRLTAGRCEAPRVHPRSSLLKCCVGRASGWWFRHLGSPL
jgi:hypothetical protein